MAQGVTSSITSDVSFESKFQLTKNDDTLIIRGATVTLLEPQGEIFTNEGNDTVSIENALIITDEPNLAFYLGSGDDHLSLKTCTISVDVSMFNGNDIVTVDGTIQTQVNLNKKLTFGAGDDILELYAMLYNAGSIDFGTSGTKTLRFNGGALLPVQIEGSTMGTIGSFTKLDVTIAGGTTGSALTLNGEQTGITLNGNFFGTTNDMDVSISGGTTTLTVENNARTNVRLNLNQTRLVRAGNAILEFSDHSGCAVTSDESVVELANIVVQGGNGLTGSNTVWSVSDCDFSNSARAINLTGGSLEFQNLGMTNFTTGALVLDGTSLTGLKMSLIYNWDGGGMRVVSAPIEITDLRANSNSIGTEGGAIYHDGGAMTLTSASFSGNTVSASVFYGSCVSAAASGGAIYHNGGNVTLTSASFSGNTVNGINGDYGDSSYAAACGGAIYHDGGVMTLTSASFSGNAVNGLCYSSSMMGPYPSYSYLVPHWNTLYSAYASGGAICCNDGDMILTGATFSGNVAKAHAKANGSASSVASASIHAYASGGAICHNGGNMTLTGATFSGNIASASASASAYVSNYSYGNVSALATAYAYAYGGAICHNGGNMTLTGATFSGNVASVYASAYAYAFGGSSSQTTSAKAYGGAIYKNGGNITLSSATFSENSAKEGRGGAIFLEGAIANMEDTVFSGNSAGYGGAIFLDQTTLNYIVTSGTKISNIGNSARWGSGGLLYAENQSTVNITVEADGLLTIGDDTGKDNIELDSTGRFTKNGTGYMLVNGGVSGTTGLWTVTAGTLELALVACALNLDNWTIGSDATLVLSVEDDWLSMGMNKKVGTIDLGGGADTINTNGFDLTDGTVLLSDLTLTGGGRVNVKLRNRSTTEGSTLRLTNIYLDSEFTGNDYTDTILITQESTLNGAIDLRGGGNEISATAKTTFNNTLKMESGNDALTFTEVSFEKSVELGGGDNTMSATGTAKFKDTLHAGAGSDILSFSSAATFEGAVDLGNGNNSLTVWGSAEFKKELNTGSGSDTLNFAGVTFGDIVDLGDGDNSLVATETAKLKKFSAGSGSDTLNFAGVTFGDIVDLGDGDNSLVATETAKLKKFSTGSGSDTLNFDSVTAEGDINLGDGDNSLTTVGSAGFAGTLTTGAGNDTLSFANVMFMGALDLGDGNNSLTASGTLSMAGVSGGSGNDTITMKGESVISGEIDLGAGVNSVYVRKSLTADKVRITEGGETTIYVYLNSTLTGNALSVYADAEAARDTITLNWSAQTDLDKVRILVSSDSTFETYEFSVELYNQTKSFTLDLQHGYFIQFQAQDEDGWKQRLLDDTVAPDQVTGVKFNGMKLSWDATHDNLGGNGVKQYHVEVSDSASFTNIIQSEIVSGTEYAPASLAEKTLYFRVKAEDYTGNIGAWSKSVSGMFDNTPPSRPSGGKMTVNAYSADLSWSPATDTGSGVAGYEYRIATDSDYGQIVVDGTTEACTISVENLNYGTYYWQVRAVDAAGNAGSWSLSKSFSTVDLAAPGIPTNLDYGIEDRTSLIVIWDAASDDAPLGSGLKGYEIQLATDSAFRNLVKTVTVSATEATIANLANANYFLRVCSVDNAGNKSAWTDTVNFTISGGEPEPIEDKTAFFIGDFNGNLSDTLAVQKDSTVTIYQNGEAWGNGLALDPGWEVVGTGDFNADKKDDFLRVNTEGYVVGEMSQGDGTFAAQVLNLKSAGWSILGTGDFNGNGSDDVLIANPTGASETVGLLGYWESGVTWTLINGYSAEWKMVSTGDFNGDGKCDMLWKNEFIGAGDLTYNAYCTWIVEDPVDWRMVSVANPAEWNFLCSGDFDGDKMNDIAMINDVGVVGIWGVNDGYLNSWSILSAVDPSAWALAGVGDFNGDGTDDIAWSNTDTGLTGYWQINNKELTAWSNLATIG